MCGVVRVGDAMRDGIMRVWLVGGIMRGEWADYVIRVQWVMLCELSR